MRAGFPKRGTLCVAGPLSSSNGVGGAGEPSVLCQIFLPRRALLSLPDSARKGHHQEKFTFNIQPQAEEQQAGSRSAAS